MPLTTKNVLGKKPAAKKAAPKAKPAGRAAGGPIVPGAEYEIAAAEARPITGLVLPDAPSATVSLPFTVPAPADHHIIPDRDYSIYRPHDAVRGCWCFPEVNGNEVQHH